MKSWFLICSTDGDRINYEATIQADSEPDFWTCYDIAAAHGCEFFTIEAAE